MATMLRRHLQMHQTKLDKQWYFRMKAHIGVDAFSGLVHHVRCAAANVADVTVMHALLHGKEDSVFGDSGDTGAQTRRTTGLRGCILHCR
ncbi:transposase family protein [Xanthomonas hortorum ATCC 19865]|nr:transposase family protein [Xanthomonas hortorum ATCC 19865]